MGTYADFVAGAKNAFWSAGDPSTAQIHRAIANRALNILKKQVEGDLAQAKSFLDSYNAALMRIAGARAAAEDDEVVAAVLELMPIEADTDGITLMRRNAILEARDDFNGVATMFERKIADCAMDLQRHVPYYQGRHETVYTSDSSELSNQGFVSQVDLPADFRIQALWVGRYHSPLEEEVAYEADDIVKSNGRFYKVTVGGTLTEGQLGDGLTSTDGDDETLGDLTFQYHCDEKLIPVRKFPWMDREALFSGRITSGPWYTISDQLDKLWLYPPLSDDRHFFLLEWAGVKSTWDDEDIVTFDRVAEQAAAENFRMFLAKDALEDGGTASASLAVYQQMLRKAVIDNQARETGTTSPTQDLLYMNLGGMPWWCSAWLNMSCTSSSSTNVPPPNSENSSDNASGATTITPQSSNHLQEVEFTGGAGTRTLALSHTKALPAGNTLCTAGDRLVVSMTFPATAGLIIDPRDSTESGDQLLPSDVFPGGVFTTDGVVTTAVIEFHYNGSAWEYLRSAIPA